MSTTTSTPEVVPEEQLMVLDGIRRGQYESIVETFGDRARPRKVYLDRRMTLWSPSARHELLADRLGDLVKIVANLFKISWESAGHITFRIAERDVGVEGDQTFYLGPDADQMRGPREIDLTTQPPPSLVIEVEVAHSAADAIVAWGRIGVREVWRFNVKRWTLVIGLRNDDGTYDPVSRSEILSPLETKEILEQMRLAEEVGSSTWFKRCARWARRVLLPRRGA